MRYPFSIDGFEEQELAVELPGLLGAPRLLLNGQPAPAGKNPREFLLPRPGGGTLAVRVEISQLGSMLSVAVGDVSVPLMKPLTWYEWTWNALPFLLVIGGGAVGGALGGLAAMMNVRLFRSVSRALPRYGLTAAISLAAVMGYLVFAGGIIFAFGDKTTGVAEKSSSPAAASSTATAAKAVPFRARSFVLPRDWKALQEVCQAEITGADRRDALTLKLGRVPENVSITVPAGTILRPVSPDAKAGAYLARQPTDFSSRPTPGGRTISLEVFNAEAARWDVPQKTDAYEPAAEEPDARVVKFIQMAQEKKFHPNLTQTGIWVLRENISSAQFAKNRLFTNTYNIDSGKFQSTSLANYGGIRKLRLALQENGLDPTTLQLFKDYRAELEKDLQRADFDNPLVNWNTMLSNGSLEIYAGEPEVEALLLKYATRHSNLSARESALRSLMKIGLAGEPAELLRQMLTTPSRESRFLAAHALAAAGDLRGQPVLAIFAEDPSLGKLISDLKNSIQVKTKVAPLPEETALVYWERAAGWEALQKLYGDVEAIRSLVTKRDAAADPWLDEYLGKLKGASDQETGTLLRTLESRYKNNARAFAAVKEVLTTHPKWQVRQSAGRSLVDGWKQSGDIRGTLVELMEKDRDHQVIADFFRHAIVFGKVPQAEPLIQAALGHRLPEVRTAALMLLANDRREIGEDVAVAVFSPEVVSRLAERDPVARVRLMTVNHGLSFKSPLPPEQAEAILLRVAAKETDKGVRSAALTRLCETKARSVLPILRKMLAGSKEEKGSAISLLDRWKNDPETLAMLESVRQDRDVGRNATNVLKRYGR